MIPICKNKAFKVHEITAVNQYLRLFTVKMTAPYKAYNVLFYFNDTQAGTCNQLCSLTVYHSNTEISIRGFRGVSFTGSIQSSLFATKIDNDTIAVYYKMSNAQSPTIQILSETKLQNADKYGKLEFDMNTVSSNMVGSILMQYAKVNNETIVYTTTTASSCGSNQKIALNQASDTSTNNKLILENGIIKVGKGVKRIKVNANVFLNSVIGTGYLWTIVKKNNNNVKGVLTPYAGGGYICSAIPDFFIDVAEGSTISLIADSSVGGTVRTGAANTWLSIEIVE